MSDAKKAYISKPSSRIAMRSMSSGALCCAGVLAGAFSSSIESARIVSISDRRFGAGLSKT